MITIVIISYNQKDTIRRCLDSVLSQELSFDMKIIIGDDGSSDGTADIIASYADKHHHIEAILRAKNIGANENYFDLVDRVDTPYIACLEADDYWIHKQKLSRQIQLLERMTDVAACFTEHHVEKSGYLNISHAYKSKKVFTTRDILFRDPPHTSSIVMRTAHVKSLPDRFRNRQLTDTLLHAWASLHGKFFKLPLVTSVWDKSSGGVWASLSPSEQSKAMDELYDMLREMNDSKWFLDVLDQAQKFNSAVYRANALNNRNGLQEKLAQMKFALSLYPEDPYLRVGLCNAYLLSEDVNSAQTMVDELERFDPDHPDVIFLNACIERQKGNTEHSNQLIKQCLATYPSYLEAIKFQIECCIKEDNLENALRIAKENKNLPDLIRNKYLGIIHHKKSQYKLALKAFDAIPDDQFKGLLHRKAQCYFRLGRISDAVACLDKLLIALPHHKGGRQLRDRIEQAMQTQTIGESAQA